MSRLKVFASRACGRGALASCWLGLAVLSGTASEVLAQPVQTSAASAPADQALVSRALGYLNGLKAAEGRFTQTDPKGQVSSGRYYLQRPGRARFDYEGAKGLLVVADGDLVTVYDRRLKTQDQYPLEQTPLSLLLSGNIRLGAGVLASTARNRGGFTVTLRDARPSAPERLILDFSDAPLTLRGWTVLDAQNGRTRVRLDTLERRASLDPSLFRGEGALPPPQ